MTCVDYVCWGNRLQAVDSQIMLFVCHRGRPKLIREKLVANASLASDLDDGFADALPTERVLTSVLDRIFNGETITEMIQGMRQSAGRLFHESRGS